TGMWAGAEKQSLWHEAKEHASCFFPDDTTVVSGDWHTAIESADSRTGAVKRTLPGGMSSVSYSPDRMRMVTTHLGGAWRVCDGGTGEVLKEVRGFRYVWSVAFSPSGWLVAVSGDNSVRVYDSATWQEVARLGELEGTESAEVRRRVRRMVARLGPPPGGEYAPEDARELRAVWALELAGTREARNLLAGWAEARVGNRLGVEAAGAVRRWRGRE